ncbi:MAG TPA: tRNA uridine-5-carboxymethylaminomethyl(34) synthesis GTPase MnmE [Acidobacteriaceae bacterium]
MKVHPTYVPVSDTITAISTPPGRGGIGIVRLSGPDAVSIAGRLLGLGNPLEHGHARFTRILDPLDPDKAPVDEAVVTAFLAPHSYTGDDVVEIAAHGSPVILEAVLQAAMRMGARLAAPGEFTQRAFLSGRLDLTQAEAVHDLIAAKTLEQARTAAQQLGGALSRRVAPAKEKLFYLIALLEAGMDFASGELDDVDVVPVHQIAGSIAETHSSLESLARSFRGGQLLRSGAALALVGRPNAGKSSLFNRLLDRPRAIVTPVAGTTRDTVEETVSLGGIPIRLIDTAGLRVANDAPADEAEQQGIARSREALADADLVLLIHDATAPLTEDERALAASLEGRPHLLIRNKIDLLPAAEMIAEQGSFAIGTSALTGEGLDDLRAAILHELHAEGALAESGALNNLRQQESVQTALTALDAAAHANLSGLPHEVLLMDLHAALRALDALTGVTTTDDILGRIFSTFCIGK